MQKAKEKFSRRKIKKSKRDILDQNQSTDKAEENDILSDDNGNGAPASDGDFESEKINSNIDFTDGGTVT